MTLPITRPRSRGGRRIVYPDHLRTLLAQVEAARREATTPKQRRRTETRERALRRRLKDAEDLACCDWAAGEAEFIESVQGTVNVPGVYERWRVHGIPARVLLRAGFSAPAGALADPRRGLRPRSRG